MHVDENEMIHTLHTVGRPTPAYMEVLVRSYSLCACISRNVCINACMYTCKFMYIHADYICGEVDAY